MQYFFGNIFVDRPMPGLILNGIYNPLLVLLSILVAIFASAMAMQIAGMAQASSSRTHRRISIITGSLALGGGIWAMHFVGMLAFELCTPVKYAPIPTMLSMLPALGASWVALQILTRGAITLPQLVSGGILVGGGIGVMHYSGMTAMEMNAILRYDPWIFALSILVAIALAMLALWIRFGLREWRGLSSGWTIIISSVVMGLAISGMHYTGMSAARFAGAPTSTFAQAANGTTFVALAVSFIAVVLTILVGGVNGAIRYRNLYLQMQFNESRLQAIFDTAVDGIVTIDGKGLVQSMNRSAERLFGWPAGEVVGKNISMLMPEPNRSLHDGYLARYRQTGQARIIGIGQEVTGLRRDGSLMPMRLAIGKVPLPKAPLFVGFISDISQRQEMELALRKSEQQYRSLIRNIPGVSFRCLFDDSWTIVFISDAILPLSGWSAADFLERKHTFAQLIMPEDRPRVLEAIAQAVAEERNYVVEYRIRHRDGRQLWLWESGSAVRNEHGQAQWIDGVILDISERRAMEEELRNAKDRAELAAASKTAFLANMSHEIRTPMNAIIGFTELLLGTSLDQTQRRHLDTVRQSSRALLGLLNDILDTAKLEKGAVSLEYVNFSLLEVVTQVADSLRLTAESKGLQLAVHYQPELGVFFQGDPLRIRQILVNLVGNAVKFTQRGSVSIDIFPDGDQVHIAVRDTGIGIAADRLERIFDPFAQADVSMSRRFGGTGLGTTIARQLVELMGGRIEVESTLDVGSVFRVRLPLAMGAPMEPDEATAFPLLPPLRILVADDVPQNIELLSLMLGNAGHQVSVAHDGAEAVQRYCSGDFDVVLMDIQMPGTDGLEATRQIRQYEKVHAHAPIPIIALTASVMDHDRLEARKSGMNGFALKPVELGKLLVEIARVTGIAAKVSSDLPSPSSSPAAESKQTSAIDWQRGVGLWGDLANLRQAIRHFLDGNRDVDVQLQQALANGDEDGATRLAHRIRGVAGNLCLPVLHKVTAQLEDAIKARAATAPLLPQLTQAFTEVGAALGPEAEVASPVELAESADRLDHAVLATLAELPEIARLAIESLHRGELNEALLLKLTSALRANGQRALLTTLAEAIDDFEFDRAAELLQHFLNSTHEDLRSKLP